jgi:hypothetical protein
LISKYASVSRLFVLTPLVGCAVLFADPIVVGTIPLSGYGTFGQSYAEPPTLQFSASGDYPETDGMDSVALDNMITYGPFSDCLSGSGGSGGFLGASGIVVIDGISSAGGSFSYSICSGGGGYVEIFDGSGNEMAYASLQAYLIMTSEIVFSEAPLAYEGTLAVSASAPVPEPGSGLLAGLGLAIFALRRFKREGALFTHSSSERTSCGRGKFTPCA